MQIYIFVSLARRRTGGPIEEHAIDLADGIPCAEESRLVLLRDPRRDKEGGGGHVGVDEIRKTVDLRKLVH